MHYSQNKIKTFKCEKCFSSQVFLLSLQISISSAFILTLHYLLHKTSQLDTTNLLTPSPTLAMFITYALHCTYLHASATCAHFVTHLFACLYLPPPSTTNPPTPFLTLAMLIAYGDSCLFLCLSLHSY